MRKRRKNRLTVCEIIRHTLHIMAKASEPKQFKSVAEFMAASGLNDEALAKLLDIDRSEATRLRLGRVYRSLLKPLKVSKVCGVPIERLAPSRAA